MNELQSVVTKAARLIFFIALPTSAFLLIFGRSFLAIFGDEYVSGYWILVILCIGQLFNSSMGSVGLLLNMTEYESYTAYGITISAIFNFILCIVIAPHFGAVGVALSVSLSLVIWNLILVYYCGVKLGINATAFK